MTYENAITYIIRFARLVGKELKIYTSVVDIPKNEKHLFKVLLTSSKDELCSISKYTLDGIIYTGKSFKGIHDIVSQRSKNSIFIKAKEVNNG